MSTPTTITSEIQKLAPSAIIELFEIDLTPLGGSLLRFHCGTNELSANVVWQGNTYTKYGVKVSGFEINGKGSLPRPRLSVTNALSAITALVLAYKDLQGAKVTRKRTLAKYMDAVNFDGGTNPTADSTASFPDDVYYIDRKVTENRLVVEFELTSAFDLQGIALPRRQVVANACPFAYRGAECGYAGTNYFKSDDTSTTNAGDDVCGKRLSSCKARFGENEELSFGGFPGANLIR
jgi:lambda family phage minor tail protein L